MSVLFTRRGEPPSLPLRRIGGRVFYDDGPNGAVYKFYDISGNEIQYTSVSELENAYSYIFYGVRSKPRFYVFDNTTHQTRDISVYDGLARYFSWGYIDIETGATLSEIGGGKINTNKILQVQDTSQTPRDRIFDYVRYCREDALNGCTDWFIASVDEQLQLYQSGLASDWYGIQYGYDIWTSTELQSNMAMSISQFGGRQRQGKKGPSHVFVARSF